MEKIKVAFYLPNKGYTDIDCRNIENGNPGIGGSEYALITVAKKLYDESPLLDVELIAENVNDMLPPMKYYQADNVNDVVNYAEKSSLKYIVFRYGALKDFDQFISIYSGPVKFIVWCENFVLPHQLKLYSKNKSIARLITVGIEQLDLYRDHAAFNKSDYIYNAVPQIQFDNIRNMDLSPCHKRKNEVTYIGSIVPGKSFHVLAKAWSQIIQEIPDAHLNVIGSGQLYNRQQHIGKFGIAEESYENSFIKYITENGKLLPSIKFWGIMGKEKEEVLSITKVGVPNPTGNTETYGFTAVELQMFGAAIATQKCPGYLDTVKQNPSILYDNPNKLAASVIKLLRATDTDTSSVLDFLEDKFSLDKIYKEWEILLTDSIPNNRPLHSRRIIENRNYRYKSIKELMRTIKSSIPFGYKIIPSIHTAKSSIKRCIKNFIKQS